MNFPLTLDMDLINYNLDDLYKELGNYNDSTENPPPENHICSTVEGPLLTSFKAVFMPMAYGLIFLLGMMGNILVLVILERHRQTRSSTETFLFHLAVADLLLVFILPFAVAEGSVGWVLGTFLCKTVIALHKINFYCSSLLLACIAVDRYLAIVHAVHAYRHRRLLSIHITCATIWLAGFFFALPEILFAKVSQPHRNDSLPLCTFSQENQAETNAWFTSRFLYHFGGFLLPMLVMCWCYVGVVHRLCQAQRRPQRQKAVRVAILVTSVFFLCWSPYHIIIFLDTLARLKAMGSSCELNSYLSVAITMSEFLGLAHCCLNPMLYTFAGVKFRSDLSRILTKLGCAGPVSLCQFFPGWRKSSLSESENATSLTTF